MEPPVSFHVITHDSLPRLQTAEIFSYKLHYKKNETSAEVSFRYAVYTKRFQLKIFSVPYKASGFTRYFLQGILIHALLPNLCICAVIDRKASGHAQCTRSLFFLHKRNFYLCLQYFCLQCLVISLYHWINFQIFFI